LGPASAGSSTSAAASASSPPSPATPRAGRPVVVVGEDDGRVVVVVVGEEDGRILRGRCVIRRLRCGIEQVVSGYVTGG
jgi:hypothetical protein